MIRSKLNGFRQPRFLNFTSNRPTGCKKVCEAEKKLFNENEQQFLLLIHFTWKIMTEKKFVSIAKFDHYINLNEALSIYLRKNSILFCSLNEVLK